VGGFEQEKRVVRKMVGRKMQKGMGREELVLRLEGGRGVLRWLKAEGRRMGFEKGGGRKNCILRG
jgi:hypothetical protein